MIATVRPAALILALAFSLVFAEPGQAQIAGGESVKPFHPPAPGEQPRWIGAIVLDRDGVEVGRITRMEKTAIDFIDVEISGRYADRFWVDKRTLTLDANGYARSTQARRQIRRQRNRQGGMPTV
jgi:hypothetical protein